MPDERVIDSKTAQELADKLEIKYFETSAKTGHTVEESIETLAKDCLSKIKDS